MSLRRLHHEQPESFAFTPANAEWARAEIAKFPAGRQASAVIRLLWRGQEQEGWVTRPMIEEVARVLGMDPIRVLEVATFYFMFHLQPVGRVAHVMVCGTTSCMICGAEDLVAVCRARIAPEPHQLSADGAFSWEEVECLGACSNAPMVQIGKDYYEDLTAESFAGLLDALARGEVPRPGPQTGRWASEPVTGRTSLFGDPFHGANASVELALARGDTIGRINGEAERRAAPPQQGRASGTGRTDAPGEPAGRAAPKPAPETRPDRKERADRPAPLPSDEAEVADERQREEAAERQSDRAAAKGNNGSDMPPRGASDTEIDEVMPRPSGTPSVPKGRPELLATARPSGPDDLKLIRGIGPKLEAVLNRLGVWHFDQIASWGPDEIAWVDSHMKFPGRIEREDWVVQARELAGRSGPNAADRGE